jgi:hypothetical protein
LGPTPMFPHRVDTPSIVLSWKATVLGCTGHAFETAAAFGDAGIAGGGGTGGGGHKASVGLFVLDDPSLAALAKIAQPFEACVTGQDPNYVQPGPQALQGPGWQWIGAGLGLPIVGPFSLVSDQASYDKLWPMLGAGPETLGRSPSGPLLIWRSWPDRCRERFPATNRSAVSS